MEIPSIVSRKDAIAKAINHATSASKPNVVPRCLFLHNGLGCFSLSDGGTERANEQLLLFPLISSSGVPDENFLDYPLMNRIYLQDRIDLVNFIDKDVGGNQVCATLFAEKDVSSYYITIPSKGISAIVPLILFHKFASVRLILKALPVEIPDLFKDIFDVIGQGIIDLKKSKEG
jgi:hypothetical protein